MYINKNLSTKNWLILGAITHLCAVIFSEGYHRPDEHLAIIHMMQFKLGTFPESLLSWEYPVMIRPWLQPFVQFSISKIYYFLGLENPFYLAFLFRLFASLTGFLSSLLIVEIGKPITTKENWRQWLLPLAMLISYLPFFHARATAENFGINFFIFGLYLTLNKKINFLNVFLAGLLFGASFIFRFQMGVPILFMGIWLWINQYKFKDFMILSSGIIAFIGISTIIDYWGYGVWTFTPWNYLYQNIFLGKASGFGVSPFYYYLTKSLAKGVPPLSLIFFTSYLMFWIKKPKHWLTWTMFSFFLIHSTVGHKELRFIFGMGMFLPISILWMGQYLEEKYGTEWFQKKSVKAVISLSLVANFVFMGVSILKPAFSPIKFYKHVYSKVVPIEKMYTLRIFKDQLRFYLKKPIDWVPATNLSKVDSLISGNQDSWFLTNNFQDIQLMRGKKECKEDYIAYPDWVFKLNFGNWMKRSKIWALYHCQS